MGKKDSVCALNIGDLYYVDCGSDHRGADKQEGSIFTPLSPLLQVPPTLAGDFQGV